MDADTSPPKAFDLATVEGRHPTWEMALLYPDQGSWKVEDYLELDIGRRVDFSTGYLEFQPMPDEKHQAIVFFLAQALKALARSTGGKATLAPFPVRLWQEKFREPDVVFMKNEHLDRCSRKFWDRADLVIEVVSESNRDGDLGAKRSDYARAGIPEYWIVDPGARTITVLVLKGEAYAVRGTFTEGEEAVAATLDGFRVDVTATMEAE